MSRLRFFLGVLTAWTLVVRDFLHEPPRPWRRRRATRNGPLIGNDVADQEVLAAGTDPTLTAVDRLDLTQQFEEIVLRLGPINPPRNPQSRGRHR